MSIGILLIHGFAGSPLDLAPLKKHLENKGFIVSSPLLKGHGLTKRDLAKSKYEEWILSAANSAKELENKCDNLYIICFSMGGLIGVNLLKNFNTEKLVFINTPVYYWDIKQITKNLYHDFKLYSCKYFNASTKKPFSSLIQFLKLLKITKPKFSTITVPTLIIQMLDDDTVNHKSADYIYKNIKGNKKIEKYKEGGHCIFANDEREDICIQIERFLNDNSLS